MERDTTVAFHVKRFRFIILLLVLATTSSACSVQRSIVTGNKRAYGYTWEQERELGKQADQQIIQQFGLYEDPELQAYVERIGQQVLQESHLRRPDTPQEFRQTPFVFRVLDSHVVNAFALPGGYIYVTRGLLNHLQNEAQLAMVLGHEIGHVAARHAAQQAVNAQLGQLGVLGGAILGGVVFGGQAAENILNVGSQAAQLLNLRYSRENEEESDKLGVEYASLAGYEAAEGAEFFTTLERIGEQAGGEIPNFLSTHPNPGDRREEIRRLAAQYEAQIPTKVVNQEEYLQTVEGTVFGENPRHGFVENDVFYHPDLRFLFPVPRGFDVVNQPLQVVLVAPNQEALQFFQISQTASAEAAARQFAQQQGVQVVESGPVRSGNLPAYYVVAQAQLQSGQDVGLLAYFVEYEGNTYSFTGLTTVQQYDRYDDVFLQVARGFARLTDSRILSIEPLAINVVPASRTASFRTFVPANLPQDVTPEDVAILNQVQLDTTIPSETLLKLPVR